VICPSGGFVESVQQILLIDREKFFVPLDPDRPMLPRLADPQSRTASSEGGLNIRPVEVDTLEQQGLGTDFGQRIDRTIDDIQLCRMPLALSEAAKRIEGGLRHFVVQRHHDNSGILQQVVEKTDRVQSQARKEGRRPMTSTGFRRRALPPENVNCPVHS
jgi:hypothetical protein